MIELGIKSSCKHDQYSKKADTHICHSKHDPIRFEEIEKVFCLVFLRQVSEDPGQSGSCNPLPVEFHYGTEMALATFLDDHGRDQDGSIVSLGTAFHDREPVCCGG